MRFAAAWGGNYRWTGLPNVFEHLIPQCNSPNGYAMIELDGGDSAPENMASPDARAAIEDTVNGRLWGGAVWGSTPKTTPFQVPEEQRLMTPSQATCRNGLSKGFRAALVSLREEHQRSIGQEFHDNLGQQIAAIATRPRRWR